MSDRRIVMRVEVIWITDDPNDLVEFAFRQYDETGKPSPVDFVADAIRDVAGKIDWSVSSPPRSGSGLEVRVDGPDRWSIAFDNEESDS